MPSKASLGSAFFSLQSLSSSSTFLVKLNSSQQMSEFSLNPGLMYRSRNVNSSLGGHRRAYGRQIYVDAYVHVCGSVYVHMSVSVCGGQRTALAAVPQDVVHCVF